MHIRVSGVPKGTSRGFGTRGAEGSLTDSDCLLFFVGGEYDGEGGEAGGVMGRIFWEGEESEESVIVDDGERFPA